MKYLYKNQNAMCCFDYIWIIFSILNFDFLLTRSFAYLLIKYDMINFLARLKIQLMHDYLFS